MFHHKILALQVRTGCHVGDLCYLNRPSPAHVTVSPLSSVCVRLQISWRPTEVALFSASSPSLAFPATLALPSSSLRYATERRRKSRIKLFRCASPNFLSGALAPEGRTDPGRRRATCWERSSEEELLILTGDCVR